MRIMVTGTGGFVGGALAARLAEQGHQVVAHYRRAPVKQEPRLSVVVADLAVAPPNVDGRIDLLVHAAAASAADHEPGGGDPDRYLRDNVVAAQNLAAWVAGGRVGSILILSSLSVYGAVDDDTVTPDSPINGPGLYGASKLFAERVLAGNDCGVPVIAARLPGVIGPAAPRNWLRAVLAKLRAGAEVVIFNPDAPFNNAVHVDDLAVWAGHLAGAPWRGSHVVTLGAATPLTVAAVVARMRTALASAAPIVTQPAPRSSFQISIVAAERFGYRPMTMAAMLDRFVLENRGGDV